MTLILGMSKDEGVYLSVDYRVTQGGAIVDDASVKFLSVTYPPDHTGPEALLAYTGIAQLPDGTAVGDWLRETLRGETEVFDRSMDHLKTRLDRDLARFREQLIINVLAVHGGRRYFGGFSNIVSDNSGQWKIQNHFGYTLTELTEPFAFANGSGAARVVADQHMRLLESQLRVRPRRVADHMKLLASVNRRVAAVESTVSPYCHVSFINADDRYEPASHLFVERGESVPFHMPTLLFGIDLSFMAQQFMKDVKAMQEGEPEREVNPDEMNEHLRRRP